MDARLLYLFHEVLAIGAKSMSPVYGSPTSYLLECMILNQQMLAQHIAVGTDGVSTCEISLNGAGLKMLIYKTKGGTYYAQVAGDQKDLYPEFVDECTTMLKKKHFFPVNSQE